jgi:hypothetical protein
MRVNAHKPISSVYGPRPHAQAEVRGGVGLRGAPASAIGDATLVAVHTDRQWCRIVPVSLVGCSFTAVINLAPAMFAVGASGQSDHAGEPEARWQLHEL